MRYLRRSAFLFVQRVLVVLTLTFVCGLFTACGDGGNPTGPGGSSAPPAPEAPSATGVWLGDMVTSFGGARNITLTLQETDSNIVGSGAIASPGNDPYYTCTVAGDRTGDSLSLTLTSDDFAPISFAGTFVSATTIDGLLNGSGWVNTAVQLTRE